MKTAITFCVIALAVQVYAMDRAEIYAKCKEESGFKGEYLDIKLDGAEKEAKCFLKCVGENKKVMKSDGTIDLDQVKAAMASAKDKPEAVKEKMFKAIEECSKEVKPDASDLCETAYKFFQCKMQKLKPKKK